MDQGEAQPEESTVEIFVAVKDLPTAQKLTADVVKLERWPQSRVPEGALVKLEQLESKFTNQSIFAREPILDRKLANSRDSLSTNMRPGYRVFDLPSAGIGYIKPGDHVDVVGTFRLEGSNVTESQTVMRNVEVFAINGVTTRDPDAKQGGGSATFQLLVKESQVEALTLATKLGELRITLRPFGEDTDGSGQADNGESFMSWAQKTEKEKSSQANDAASVIQSALTAALGPVATQPEEPEEAPNEMLIVTPNGVARYQWRKDNEMPRLVDEAGEKESKTTLTLPPPSSWPVASGNVYSGYGGYTPTYPTSTNMAPGGVGLPGGGQPGDMPGQPNPGSQPEPRIQ
jgi:pilus assembly protein CpaB